MSRGLKIIIAVFAVVIVAVLILVVYHYQLRASMEAYITQLKAQDEPMDLAQVLPPPVPPGQNGADTLREAASLLRADEDWLSTNSIIGMKMVAPGKAMTIWQQAEVHNEDHNTSWQDIDSVLAKNKEAFALLQQITSKPDFDFEIHYEHGFDDFSFTNLFLTKSKRAAQELSTAVISELHQGDSASAVKNLRAIVAIDQGLRNERFMISEMVRMAIAQIAAATTWDLLQSSNLTDAQLAQLQQDWTVLDFVQSYENALEMERAMARIAVAGGQQSNAQLDRYYNEMQDPSGKGKFLPAGIFLWRYWSSYSDELRALRGWQVMINTVRMAETNESFQGALEYQNENLNKLGITKLEDGNLEFLLGYRNLLTMQSQSVALFSSSVTRREIKVEAAKKTVIAAIAIKRYQLKYRNYPTDLKALVPEFLPKLPLDPADGHPLRYHLKENGTFLLYSVAENGKDDGGNPCFRDRQFDGSPNFYWLDSRSLDWVWPQPATEKEIEDYYAHPPK